VVLRKFANLSNVHFNVEIVSFEVELSSVVFWSMVFGSTFEFKSSRKFVVSFVESVELS
jgi:hypothetical protein